MCNTSLLVGDGNGVSLSRRGGCIFRLKAPKVRTSICHEDILSFKFALWQSNSLVPQTYHHPRDASHITWIGAELVPFRSDFTNWDQMELIYIYIFGTIIVEKQLNRIPLWKCLRDVATILQTASKSACERELALVCTGVGLAGHTLPRWTSLQITFFNIFHKVSNTRVYPAVVGH